MNYKEIYRRPIITDRKWVMPFGKHKGLTIGFLMDAEPQYLLWLIAQEIIELDFHLQNEFEDMNPWITENPLDRYEWTNTQGA